MLFDEVDAPETQWARAPRQVSIALTNACDQLVVGSRRALADLPAVRTRWQHATSPAPESLPACARLRGAQRAQARPRDRLWPRSAAAVAVFIEIRVWKTLFERALDGGDVSVAAQVDPSASRNVAGTVVLLLSLAAMGLLMKVLG
ncbi:hypothetical protein [Streptomyces sp. NPDC048637]|uniref:hypothetical protein n=1 Tax=Streptomyces sp. NPDC048637 TaxID=3155636 RepID=UPI00344A4789